MIEEMTMMIASMDPPNSSERPSWFDSAGSSRPDGETEPEPHGNRTGTAREPHGNRTGTEWKAERVALAGADRMAEPNRNRTGTAREPHGNRTGTEWKAERVALVSTNVFD